MQQCSDCRSSDIKEDINDGSYVCTRCGLVTDSYMLDDRPLMRAGGDTLDMSSFSFEKEFLFYNICEKLCLPQYVAEKAVNLYNDHTNKLSIRATNRVALKAVSFYLACSEFSFMTYNQATIAFVFDVSMQSFSAILKTLTQQEKPNRQTCTIPPSYVRLRSIVSVICGNNSKEMNRVIVKKAHEYEEKMKRMAAFVNKKPSKMDVVIVYHVSLKMKSSPKSAEFICKTFDVSLPTFKKNLILLANHFKDI